MNKRINPAIFKKFKSQQLGWIIQAGQSNLKRGKEQRWKDREDQFVFRLSLVQSSDQWRIQTVIDREQSLKMRYFNDEEIDHWIKQMVRSRAMKPEA